MVRVIDKIQSHHRAYFLVMMDAVLTGLSISMAFFLHFQFSLAIQNIQKFAWILPVFISIRVITFFFFRLYSFLWRYASVKELVAIVESITLSSMVMTVLLLVLKGNTFPVQVLVIEWSLAIILVGFQRVSLRLTRDYLMGRSGRAHNQGTHPVIIIGAGDAGEMIAREILRSSILDYRIVGFVDDKKSKLGRKIHHIPVLGTLSDLPKLVQTHQVQEVIIAIPSATGAQIRTIADICKDIGVAHKITPGLYEILDGKVSVNQLRDIRIEDLLGRKEVSLDTPALSRYISGKKVMVTGAGGSIGSELCRQALRYHPSTLILIDHSEYHLYEVDMELTSHHTNTQVVSLVADVKNRDRLERIFTKHQPDIVFHAAAYKHVPLMEENVEEVILNNIGGTQNVFECSVKYNVHSCVLISTDKAVNPVNCMGASKRVCEILMGLYSQKGTTQFSAVRFGNVLGSKGSVVPLFQRQIASGGPITITHPDVIRYFMTIEEAVSLVIQAGALSEGGEIFVLDMGEPVKITNLAKDMIQLSGLEVGKDIDIVYVGLRPGEKLQEELFFSKEDLKNTHHDKIFVAAPYVYDENSVQKDLTRLLASIEGSPDAQKSLLLEIAQTTSQSRQKEPSLV